MARIGYAELDFIQNMQPLSVSKFDFKDEAWDQNMMKNLTFGGKTYGTTLQNTHISGVYVMFYNKALIDKYNYEDPYKLWKKGKTAALGDHALDVHGEGGMCRELTYPYEIPIECTETNEFDNLFVACRGASFSHIASASTRLSRTLMSLGEGVGEHLAVQCKMQFRFAHRRAAELRLQV